jgi:hypothetical protein
VKRSGPIKRKKPLTAAQHLTRRIVKNKRAKVSSEERSARKIVSERSQDHCELCGKPAESMHHRKKAGRVWAPSNLIHTCGDGVRGCHGHIEANPAASKEQGWWLIPIQDPAQTPVWFMGRGFVFLGDDGSINDSEEENDAA